MTKKKKKPEHLPIIDFYEARLNQPCDLGGYMPILSSLCNEILEGAIVTEEIHDIGTTSISFLSSDNCLGLEYIACLEVEKFYPPDLTNLNMLGKSPDLETANWWHSFCLDDRVKQLGRTRKGLSKLNPDTHIYCYNGSLKSKFRSNLVETFDRFRHLKKSTYFVIHHLFEGGNEVYIEALKIHLQNKDWRIKLVDFRQSGIIILEKIR